MGQKPNAVPCFAWSWSPSYPGAGDIIPRGQDFIPPWAVCRVTGLLNPIATEDPILICSSLILPSHNNESGSILVANGPSWVKQRHPFTGYVLGQRPEWIKYSWPDVFGEEPEPDGEWPTYWYANGAYDQWSLTPATEGLVPTAAVGTFARIGKPDTVRGVVCVQLLYGVYEQNVE